MRRITGTLAALALVAVACGGGADEPATTAAPATTQAPATTAAPATTQAPTTTAAPATTQAPTTAAPAGPVVAVSTSSLGSILVDGLGNSLYLFVPDGQSDSTCYDGCATNWPPLTQTVVGGDGIDGSLLGTVARTDGTTQVTYNGWPLYYFAADGGPGDTNGQGVGDVWFVLSPAGEAIR